MTVARDDEDSRWFNHLCLLWHLHKAVPLGRDNPVCLCQMPRTVSMNNLKTRDFNKLILRRAILFCIDRPPRFLSSPGLSKPSPPSNYYFSPASPFYTQHQGSLYPSENHPRKCSRILYQVFFSLGHSNPPPLRYLSMGTLSGTIRVICFPYIPHSRRWSSRPTVAQII